MSISTGASTRKTGPRYPWMIVGLLWFCGFFNYADRQAVFSVFPLLKEEFGLTQEQKGLIGSAFMLVYALSAPLAGFVVDRLSRRFLIVSGLAFWSLVCAATALARTFNQLLMFRAAEGLGETFYFPASMSILADYHGPRTRSRAMSIHQTSVYAGTALGGIAAGYMGEHFGWRSPFWILGLVGLLYAGWLGTQIVEPARSEDDATPAPRFDHSGEELPPDRPGFLESLGGIFRTPAAVMLLMVFGCANFVAAVFLTWLTDFVYTKFGYGLTDSAIIANIFTMASLVGALLGGVTADWAARRPGGRILTQAFGLFVGAPFIYAVGMAGTIPLLIGAMIVVGLCKGFYDANIFASVYDVVPARMRGTTAGLMNTIGWAFASLGPWSVGKAADTYGLSGAIGSLCGVYVLGGLLALVAAWLAAHRKVAAG